MSSGSEELLIKGTVHGNIAGITRKDLSLFYLELTTRHMHVFEGHEDPHAARKHLRSIEIKDTDTVVPERPLKFVLVRADGSNSAFKCDTEYMKQKWISALKKAIEKRSTPGVIGARKAKSALHQPLPQLPGSDSGGSSPNDSGSGSVNVRLSKMSMDSGLGVSDNGQVCTDRQHHSGGETHHRPTIKVDKTKTCSDSAMFEAREELDNHLWFWGDMNRADSETRMKAEGEIGNFAIRVNATGHFVMTFWRSDGMHHHKIIHQVGIYRFEKTAVKAEGNSLVDLLDNYMKNCIDKKIIPYGGVLHLVYDEAWNPPEIDHEQLQKNLLTRKDIGGRRQLLHDVLQAPQSSQPQAKNPRRKGKEYTVVSGTSDARESELTQTLPPSSTLQKVKQFKMSEKSTPATATKKKPLPVPPTKKKPPVKTEAVNPNKRSPSDKRNNPLPPTPPAQVGSSNPKTGRPKPTPRGKHSPNSPSSPVHPSPSWSESSAPTSLSPPPQEQAVYQNMDFGGRSAEGGRGKKKKPVPPPTSKTRSAGHTPQPETTPASPELDVGGHELYENTAFGDTSENAGELYANMPVSQQKGKKAHNGHHRQTGAAPYQNVSHDGSDGGTAYQNIDFSSRGHRRKF